MFWKPEYQAKEIIISLDFNGVLANGLKAKIKYSKEWFGADLTIEQTKEKGFNDLMKSLGKNINYRDIMDPLNEQHIMEYEVPPFCIEFLKRLYSDGFRFVVITSRNEHDYAYAKMFVERRFEGIIKYMHNTRDEPKDRFVNRLRVRAHMDDDLKKLNELENTSAQLLYYRQPENKHVDLPFIRSSRFHEIHDWKEFYDTLQYIKDMHEAICWSNGIDNNSLHLKEIDNVCRKLSKKEIQYLINQCKSIKEYS